MHELSQTLGAMGSAQLVAAFLFLAGYGLAIGRLATDRGRGFSLLLAAASAVAFVALTRPWVHGALLIALAVLGVAAFISVVWLASALLARSSLAAAQGKKHPALPSTVTAALASAPRARPRRRSLSPL